LKDTDHSILSGTRKVFRGYQISNSKYDSQRARRDLQNGHNEISFGSANLEKLQYKDSDHSILSGIRKVSRVYQISNSKYDSERARRDLQNGHNGISFGSANPEKLQLNESEHLIL
jgi:hypothetical protein